MWGCKRLTATRFWSERDKVQLLAHYSAGIILLLRVIDCSYGVVDARHIANHLTLSMLGRGFESRWEYLPDALRKHVEIRAGIVPSSKKGYQARLGDPKL